jgi:hypothetical protein
MYVYVVFIAENATDIRGVFTSGRKAKEIKEMLKNKYPLLNLQSARVLLDRLPRGEE